MSWCRCRRSLLPHDIVSDMKWWYTTYSVLYISTHPSIHASFPSVRLFSLPLLTTRRTPQPFTEDKWSESPTGRADLDFKHSQRAVMLEEKAVNEHQWSRRGEPHYIAHVYKGVYRRDFGIMLAEYRKSVTSLRPAQSNGKIPDVSFKRSYLQVSNMSW